MTKAYAEAIKRRVLMPPTLDEEFFKQRAFVTVTSMFGTDSTIQLGVTIPGKTEEAHNQLLNELRDYLERTLVGLYPEWVYDVELELDGAQSTIEVHISNAQWMGFNSESLILDAVRVFMTVQARWMYRRLSILNSRQLLVPLHFAYPDILNSSVTLQLPQELKLVDAVGRDIEPGSESYDRACDILRETIQVAMRSRNLHWKSLRLVATLEGMKLGVRFDGANPPKAYELNMFEAIVAAALGTHCRYSDVYDTLLFQPVYEHTVELDEPAEDYDGF